MTRVGASKPGGERVSITKEKARRQPAEVSVSGQDKRLRNSEFFLIRRFAVPAAVSASIVEYDFDPRRMSRARWRSASSIRNFSAMEAFARHRHRAWRPVLNRKLLQLRRR